MHTILTSIDSVDIYAIRSELCIPPKNEHIERMINGNLDANSDNVKTMFRPSFDMIGTHQRTTNSVWTTVDLVDLQISVMVSIQFGLI